MNLSSSLCGWLDVHEPDVHQMSGLKMKVSLTQFNTILTGFKIENGYIKTNRNDYMNDKGCPETDFEHMFSIIFSRSWQFRLQNMTEDSFYQRLSKAFQWW